jgi:signal transduction histidine kinase
MSLRLPELSLRTRLAILFAAIAAFVALAPSAYLPRALEEQSRRWVERRCLDVASAVAGAAEAPLDFDDRRTAQEILGALESTKGAAYAALLRPDGSALATWRDPPPDAPPPGAGPIAYGRGVLQARADVKLPSGGHGALVVGFTLDELAERRREAQQLVVRTSLLVLLVAITAAFGTGAFILRPLQHVTALATRIARGDESAARDLGAVARGGETGQVAEALETVVDRLQRLNASLEQRVDERTRDLAAANAELGARLAELKKTQAQLVVADRRLSLGRLAAGAAHEINNPLSYVSANVRFVSQELKQVRDALRGGAAEDRARAAEDVAEMLDALAHAHDGATRIAHIVRSLKTFSHSNDDERAPLKLSEAMDVAIDMAAHELKHRARLERCYGPAPLVEASSVRLTQVFLNLLVNAAHAIPEGASDAVVRAAIGTDENGCAFAEVSDTGAGIPPDVMARLFEPFFTTKPVGKGTGLGLSISQGIVTALGGRITVASEVGRGAAFRVTLPALSGPSRVPPPAPAPAPPSPRRARVLVIDDEPLVGAAVRRVLAREHDVEVATTGAAALERVERGERFDLVLCDLVMPRMTGPQLAAELARIAPAQAEALLFMTGGTFTDGARQFAEAHAGRLLDKPIDPEALRRHVHARLET